MRSSPFATRAAGPDPLLAGSAGFAHRGLHAPGVPENSMAAFRAAIAADVGIECDLRLSRDGFAMVFHDKSLKRLCGLDVEPESLHAAQLMHFSLGDSDERIPWLGDLLELVAGQVPLLLELKNRAGAVPIAHLCRATALALRNYAGPVAVMGFDPRCPAWFGAHAPAIRRGLVLDATTRWYDRLGKLWVGNASLIAVEYAAIDQPWVARLRSSGRDIACWTIRTPTERKTATVHADALIWEAHGRP